MAQAQGVQSYLGIQKETTFGVAPGVPALLKLPFSSESISKSVGLDANDHITSGRNPRQPRRGTVDVAGSINFNLGFYPGQIFLGALGSVVTADSTHTIKIGSQLPSFTLEKGFTDVNQFFLYHGCKINRFALTASQSGFQKCSIDIMGASETASGDSFHSGMTDLGDAPLDGFMLSAITEGGAAIASLTEATLEISNNLDGDTFVLGGGGTRKAINDGLATVSGTIKGFFEDLILYNKAVNNTESSLALTYQSGNGDGSAGNEKLIITIPELVYSVKTPAISGPQGIYYELDWQAFYGDSTEATACQIELLNTQASL